MLSEAQSAELTRRFQRNLERISTRAGAISSQAWLSLGSWNEQDVERFARLLNDTFAAAGAAAVNQSAGYYQLLLDEPVALRAGTIEALADFRAPFTLYWQQLRVSEWAAALQAGESRARSIGVDTVTQASRGVAERISGRNIVGWRRTITRNACDWCRDISRQRYRTAESANFGHDNCDCVPVPIFGDRDPGQVVNSQLIEQIASGVPELRV